MDWLCPPNTEVQGCCIVAGVSRAPSWLIYSALQTLLPAACPKSCLGTGLSLPTQVTQGRGSPCHLPVSPSQCVLCLVFHFAQKQKRVLKKDEFGIHCLSLLGPSMCLCQGNGHHSHPGLAFILLQPWPTSPGFASTHLYLPKCALAFQPLDLCSCYCYHLSSSNHKSNPLRETFLNPTVCSNLPQNTYLMLLSWQLLNSALYHYYVHDHASTFC